MITCPLVPGLLFVWRPLEIFRLPKVWIVPEAVIAMRIFDVTGRLVTNTREAVGSVPLTPDINARPASELNR